MSVEKIENPIPAYINLEARNSIAEYFNYFDFAENKNLYRIIVDPNLKEIWVKLAVLEKANAGVSKKFFEYLKWILIGAENYNEQGKIYLESVETGLKKVRGLKKSLSSLLKAQKLFSEKENLNINKAVSYIHLCLVRSKQDITDKHWGEVIFGAEFIEIGNFRASASKGAQEIYAIRVLSIVFNKFFKAPQHLMVGLVAAVMYKPDTDFEEREKIANRVQKYMKKNLIKKRELLKNKKS